MCMPLTELNTMLVDGHDWIVNVERDGHVVHGLVPENARRSDIAVTAKGRRYIASDEGWQLTGTSLNPGWERKIRWSRWGVTPDRYPIETGEGGIVIMLTIQIGYFAAEHKFVWTNAPVEYDYAYVIPLGRGYSSEGDEGRYALIPSESVEYQTDRYRSGLYQVEIEQHYPEAANQFTETLLKRLRGEGKE